VNGRKTRINQSINHLPDPQTFLSDKDQALMNSIKTVFPQTDFTPRWWHVNKNIFAKSRSFFRRDSVLAIRGPQAVNDPAFLESVKMMEQAFIGRWWAVVNAPTIPELVQAWTGFYEEYKSYDELLCTLKPFGVEPHKQETQIKAPNSTISCPIQQART
jgi:hypothetical protein